MHDEDDGFCQILSLKFKFCWLLYWCSFCEIICIESLKFLIKYDMTMCDCYLKRICFYHSLKEKISTELYN